MLLHRSSIAINYKMNTFEFWAKTNSIFIVSSLYTMIENEIVERSYISWSNQLMLSLGSIHKPTTIRYIDIKFETDIIY